MQVPSEEACPLRAESLVTVSVLSSQSWVVDPIRWQLLNSVFLLSRPHCQHKTIQTLTLCLHIEGTDGCHGLLDTLVRCLHQLYILQTMELGRKEPWDLFVPPIAAYQEQLALSQLNLIVISESQHLGCGHLPVWPSSTEGVIKRETDTRLFLDLDFHQIWGL